MDRAVDFYSRVLTFEKVSDTEVAGENFEHLEGVFGLRMRVVRMRLGDEFIELTEYLAPKAARSRLIHAATIAGFSTSRSSSATWTRHMPGCARTRWSTPPRSRSGFRTGTRMPAGISAFYFKDPDGHPIEVLHFPSDKGQEKWHRPTDKLFLGIDHTAIVCGTPTPA